MASIPGLKGKRLLIDKANASMLVTIGVTSFIVIFSLVSSKALISQAGYQSRVIKAKETALKQLKNNNKSVTSLVASYKSFAAEPANVIDGNPAGTGPNDGDNPTIILDALPSKYDFPGLVSSLEKLLTQGGYKIESIGGTDDEIAQQNAASQDPAPVPIPFPLSITTNYDGAQNLLVTLERSIRPINLNQLTMTANGSNVHISATANTFYQPEKTLKITSKVIK